MSSTTFDLVLVSDKDKVSQSGVIDIGISDHCLVYCTRNVTKNTFNKHNTVKVRSMKNYNPETFQTNLLNADWHQVMISDNVTEAWENFKEIFLFIINNMAPIKELRINQRTELWISNDILRSISERDRAFHDYKKHRTTEKHSHFKPYETKPKHLFLMLKETTLNKNLKMKRTQNHYGVLSKT